MIYNENKVVEALDKFIENLDIANLNKVASMISEITDLDEQLKMSARLKNVFSKEYFNNVVKNIKEKHDKYLMADEDIEYLNKLVNLYSNMIKCSEPQFKKIINAIITETDLSEYKKIFEQLKKENKEVCFLYFERWLKRLEVKSNAENINNLLSEFEQKKAMLLDKDVDRTNNLEEQIKPLKEKYNGNTGVKHKDNDADNCFVRTFVVIGDVVYTVFGVNKYLKSNKRLQRLSKKYNNALARFSETDDEYYQKKAQNIYFDLSDTIRPNNLRIYLTNQQKIRHGKKVDDRIYNFDNMEDLQINGYYTFRYIKSVIKYDALMINEFSKVYNQLEQMDQTRYLIYIGYLIEFLKCTGNLEYVSFLANSFLKRGESLGLINKNNALGIENMINKIIDEHKQKAIYHVSEGISFIKRK